MYKLIIFAILLILSNSCLSHDERVYDGIWQSTTNESHYYSIQTKNQQVVLIDLSAIELSGSTLGSSYIGTNNNNTIEMTSVLLPTAGIILGLTFQSPNEGTIIPGCAISGIISNIICTVTPIIIRKIF